MLGEIIAVVEGLATLAGAVGLVDAMSGGKVTEAVSGGSAIDDIYATQHLMDDKQRRKSKAQALKQWLHMLRSVAPGWTVQHPAFESELARRWLNQWKRDEGELDDALAYVTYEEEAQQTPVFGYEAITDLLVGDHNPESATDVIEEVQDSPLLERVKEFF